MDRSKVLLVTVSSTMKGQVEYAQEISRKITTLFEDFKELENIGVITSVAMANRTLEHLKDNRVSSKRIRI